MTPEQKARVSIDALLVAAGWHVCNVANANILKPDLTAPGSDILAGKVRGRLVVNLNSTTSA